MQNTSTKVWFFIIGSSLTLLVLGYQLGERLGLLVSFFLALLLNILVFFYGESRVLKTLHARKIGGQDAWGLLEQIKKISAELQMSTPSVYIIPTESVNAFAVGHSWRRGSLGFTSGLLQTLESEELKAVIAYQLCQIRRLDTFAFSVSSTLANAIVGFGQLIDSLLPYQLHFFMPLFSPLGWFIIKLVVDKKSFYENDLMAAQLIEDRRTLGEVLWRLEGLAQTRPLAIPTCTSHLFIVNPEGLRQRNIFLKSHPKIELRLQKLLGYYPI